MKKEKIAIIGHFGGKKEFLDGQTIKTKIFYNELKRFGVYNIKTVDTYYKDHNILKLILCFFYTILTCNHIIILVAGNGMKVMFPILYFCSKFFKKKVYHLVIGASLANRVEANQKYKKYLNSFEVNWCETKGLVKKLLELDVTNAELLYNCKRLTPIPNSSIHSWNSEPYKLCTFSRVMKEKGIEDAISAIRAINENSGRVVYELDIFGQVDTSQFEWFENLKSEFPNYVNYCGEVPFDACVEVLKDYFALLFPTRYKTEGVPGTIIDSYAAGLPIIASKWENFDNIIDENTGIGYEFGCVDDLIKVLEFIQGHPDFINEKREYCLKKYKLFSPDIIIKKVLDKIRK